MTKGKRTQIRIMGLVSLALVIAAVTYGFAEVNTVHSAGVLGSGYGVKSTYKVSKINYELDVESPTSIVAVKFEVDQEDEFVTAGVSATEKGKIIWSDDCELISTKWTCTFNESVDVLAADWLHVSPVQ
ncbi:MAG: hypothetical protein KAJ19_29275 [Gammaproteobacteria bacterium]|nr:hypothetical protein [Gammaproteobacteria bacterium]